MSGSYALAAGQVVAVLVGQPGEGAWIFNGGPIRAGGGGGSFVALVPGVGNLTGAVLLFAGALCCASRKTQAHPPLVSLAQLTHPLAAGGAGASSSAVLSTAGAPGFASGGGGGGGGSPFLYVPAFSKDPNNALGAVYYNSTTACGGGGYLTAGTPPLSLTFTAAFGNVSDPSPPVVQT